jgi:hypothetical protein
MFERMRDRLLVLALAGGSATACSALLGEAGSDVVAAAACPEWGSGRAVGANFVADASLNAQIGVFVQSALEIAALTKSIAGEVRIACTNMGRDLGLDDAKLAPADGPSGDVKGPCAAVAARIDEIMSAQARVEVRYTPPKCSVNADFEAQCHAECKVEIDPGRVVAQCEPAHLSGRCEGTCHGECEGSCHGECQGECSAKDAQGRCVGSCSGTCKGRCDATCHARCEGTWKAPHCAVEIERPKAEAECAASCKARADVKAACTKPSVDVRADAAAGDFAKLAATLRTNLPALVNAQIRLGRQLRHDVELMADAGASLRGRLQGAGSHAIACVGAAVNAMAEASVRVSVSVEVSASVSGKVGAKAG